MRSCLSAVVLALLPGLAAAADTKPASLPPIEVVKINRTDPIGYDKDVEPILVNKCMFCHSGNVIEGKFDMTTYESLMKGGATGSAIVPGKSAESLLIHRSGRTKKPFMPPPKDNNEPLTPPELALIKLWVDQGAKPPSAARAKPKIVLSAPNSLVHPVRAAAIGADKKLVAASKGNQIHVYDAAKGEYLRALVDPKLTTPDSKPLPAAHLSLVESLAFAPDGKTLASGSFQEVILWDATTGELKQRLTGFADRVVTLSFSPDGKQLATGGGAPTEDGEIKVFTVADGKLAFEVKNGHSDTVFGVCFSPDGTKLATCGADKFVKVFEVPSGKLLKSFEGHTHHVLDVGWKADGKILASAGADNTIKIWDYEKGEQVRTIQGHTKQVTRLVFLKTQSVFLTCSGDQTARMWNADNGGNVRQFPANDDFLYAAAASPDGALVVLGGEKGAALFNGQNSQLIKALAPPGDGPPAAKPKK